MDANQTVIRSVIDGTKQQYLVPLFQRPYSWDVKQWDALWENLIEIAELVAPRKHFIGSIVTMQTNSVPEGVNKYLLIDGQQRLTTIFILLTLLRDKAREEGQNDLADEITDFYLVNKYKKNNDYYKLLPTQADRPTFKAMILGTPFDTSTNRISKAYAHFRRKLDRTQLELDKLKAIVTESLAVVSILLDPDDNPYLVFESLNAKGLPLSQSDLIRNLFFLRIHSDQHEEIHANLWQPMQDRLGEDLTEFIRHYLMKDGQNVRQTDVYLELKTRVSNTDSIETLEQISYFARLYHKLSEPDEQEVNPAVRRALLRLNRLQVTTAYPLLLASMDDREQGRITSEELAHIIETLENYILRRFVCNIPTYGLNKILTPLYYQANRLTEGSLVGRIRSILQSKGYPKDTEFRQRLVEAKVYGAGDRRVKTSLLLESLEEHHAHKESTSSGNLSIEHIMPQTLTEAWRVQLGDDGDEDHDLFLHTLGNLTLTGYNSEMSNESFEDKRKILCESHIELNKYFRNVTQWGRQEIEKRAEHLAGKALEIWPYFGYSDVAAISRESVKLVPKMLHFLGKTTIVATWRDVFLNTANAIIEVEPERFQELLDEYPVVIGWNQSRFRESRMLVNGAYINVNLSASSIRKFCRQFLVTLDIGDDEWSVETVSHTA